MSVTDDKHYSAQICENGHVITPQLENFPGMDQRFCVICGVATLSGCTKCKRSIRGNDKYGLHRQGRDELVGEYPRPSYCAECGAPFPWTMKALSAAHELARMELDDSEAQKLADIIEDLGRDSPSTPLSVVRFKKYMERLGPTAQEAFKAILWNLATEGVKKALS